MTKSTTARRAFVVIGLGLVLFGTPRQSEAVPFVLNFEGLQSLEPIGQFYNGGLGGFGSGPGPNFGISFTSDSIVLRESHPLASFANAPSPETAAFFLTGTAIMNSEAGFDTAFSFFYSNTTFVGWVAVYDGLNATGNTLAWLMLPALGECDDPLRPFCNWAAVGVSFAGLARSVDFGGTVNQIGFDDITLGSMTPGETPSPVPEPATITLLGTGLAAWLSRRYLRDVRKRAAQRLGTHSA